MTNQFHIATSIAPKGIDIQKVAIQSWLDLEFTVYSFNIQAEIDQLRTTFPSVHFIPVHRDGRERTGKPLVYIQDMLHWFIEHKDIPFGGFINSDIVVRPPDPQAYIALIHKEIELSILYAKRIEVADINHLQGVWNRTGIDLWYWDRRILECYSEPADYLVGFPHWDYYMELMPICYGIPTKELRIPHAFHQTHDAYYNWIKDALPFALKTFNLISPHLDKVPDKDHLLIPIVNYCLAHLPRQVTTDDDVEFLAMTLSALDKFFLETIQRRSIMLTIPSGPSPAQAIASQSASLLS